MTAELKRGLEGVVVTESELSRVDGEIGELLYRGYQIQDLAQETSFEEVLHLLWDGSLPNQDELDELKASLATHRSLSADVLSLLERLAAVDEEPMAALRSGASALSSGDTQSDKFDPSDAVAAREIGLRITAKLPTILAAFDRYRSGKEPIAPRSDLDHAANFLYMLTGEVPDPVVVDTFDTALVLHADHGLNASTFSAMVTASTFSDIYSAITSAIGTLAGPLHGGANANVMRMLLDVEESAVPADEWVRNTLNAGERVPGFGHRVYQVKDPRAYILSDMSRSLGEANDDLTWFDISVAIEETMDEETGISPNVDFYSATTYYQMGIPVDLFTPIFALSRVGGWVAHVLEQYADNRIMRPRARYVGPTDQSIVPIADR